MHPRLPARDAGHTPATGRWTSLGALDAGAEARVDSRGTVATGRGWALEWWIGAEDRWRLPAREPVGVRQSLVDATPVIDTRVWVPSGDAVQRTFVARAVDGQEVLVVEIENASAVPVAVALAIVPVGGVRRIALTGAEVHVDGRLAAVLPKPPPRVATTCGDHGSGQPERHLESDLLPGSRPAGAALADVVLSGRAGEQWTDARCPAGGAAAAFVFPLAHTATLRAVLPLGEPAARRRRARGAVVPASLPSAAQVARGWDSLTAGALRVEVPDRRLQTAFDASRRYLLARPLPDDAAELADVAVALDRCGFRNEAARALAQLARRGSAVGSGACVWAIGEHWALHHDVAVVEQLLPVAVADAERALASGIHDERVATGLRHLAQALDRVGQRAGAADATRLAAAVQQEHPRAEATDPDAGVAAWLESASPTSTWAQGDDGHHAATGAAFVSRVRSMLVRERDDGGLALAPVVPSAWLGQGWEIHDAPTAAGRVGYAVRWHGERPALLWDLQPHGDADSITLDAPGLDPSWSTTDPRGEALLAPMMSTAPPGSFA